VDYDVGGVGAVDGGTQHPRWLCYKVQVCVGFAIDDKRFATNPIAAFHF